MEIFSNCSVFVRVCQDTRWRVCILTLRADTDHRPRSPILSLSVASRFPYSANQVR
jgi:hypothetical protein